MALTSAVAVPMATIAPAPASVTATVTDTATATDTDTDADSTLNAGLLPRLRLNGGSGAASSEQRGHVWNEDGLTTLLGRAAAYLGAGATDP